jgi:predicted MFS family arabinose efflux permease
MSQARQDGITLKQWLPLIGLTCCAFVFNTSEFMPIGLLTDIAASFSLTEAQAGIMISVYAWGVMLLSLPLMVFASRFEFKRMLLGVLAVFSLGQFLSAVAPIYPILVCARLVVACAHAVFWSVASIMASRLVDTRHGALAISMIATGSSIAQIFGLPLGRAIGLAVGWRMTFAVVGALSAAAVVYQAAVFPAMPIYRVRGALRLSNCPSCSRTRSSSRFMRSRCSWQPAIMRVTAISSRSWHRSRTSTQALLP